MDGGQGLGFVGSAATMLLSGLALCALLTTQGRRGRGMVGWSLLALVLPFTLPFLSLAFLFGWRGVDEPRPVPPWVALLLMVANGWVLWLTWLDLAQLFAVRSA